MITLRTVVVTLPPMLRDMVVALSAAGHANLQLAAEFASRPTLKQDLARLRPDLILLGLARNETEQAGAALLAWAPDARLIAFSHDGRLIYVHEQGAGCTVLADASAERVLSAITHPRTARI